MRKFVAALALLALATFVATFPIRQSFASRAQLIQRVEPSAASDLFGDASGTPIGSPQMLIVDEPAVFLPDVAGQPRQVDETKLKERGIYPLQLKTVDFFAAWTRGVAGGVGLVLGLIWALLGRRRPKPAG